MVKHMQHMLLCVFLLVPQWVNAAAIAMLDQQITSFGESVTLLIKVDSNPDGDPDFSPLKQDFDILNQSQSSNYSVINGSFSRSYQWQLTLMPKRLGMLQIPAINIGNMTTQALKLQVLKSQTATTKSNNKDIYLEVKASADEVYVQAQLLLDVKLFRAVNLAQAELSEPDIAHSIIKKIGEDRSYETVVNQRRFIVTQRQYAVFPQQSGKLEIPAVQFDGRLSSGRGAFAQAGKAIRLRSEPVQVMVKGKPDGWDKTQTWLPATNLSLREIWTDGQSTTYRVGEPLTRTIELRGTGLTASQLPTLFSTQDINGFKQYPDQPVLDDEQGQDGIIGIRREKVAMIPTKAGELTLPGVSVKWWSTQTHEVKTMLIPARVIEVLPASNAAGLGQTGIKAEEEKKVTPPLNNETEADKLGEKNVVQTAVAESPSLWKIVSMLVVLGWLITILFWFFTARSKKARPTVTATQDAKTDPLKLKSIQRELESACKRHDAAKALQLLPLWGELFFEAQDLIQVSQLKGKSEALNQAIEALEKYLYGQGTQKKWAGKSLLNAILASENNDKSAKEEVKLKSLYS